MANIKCFLIGETDSVQLYPRRYSHRRCAGEMSYHNATADVVQTVTIPAGAGETIDYRGEYEDSVFPKRCSCGYEFAEDDEWQIFPERLWQRAGFSTTFTLRDAPVGSIWNAWWMSDCWKGEDGRSMVVRCPGNFDWPIDGPASNCTRRDDPNHRCWIRHGVPPALTVNKDTRGSKFTTCSAGAGSIQVPGWHGFLTDGELRKC